MNTPTRDNYPFFSSLKSVLNLLIEVLGVVDIGARRKHVESTERIISQIHRIINAREEEEFIVFDNLFIYQANESKIMRQQAEALLPRDLPPSKETRRQKQILQETEMKELQEIRDKKIAASNHTKDVYALMRKEIAGLRRRLKDLHDGT